MLRYDHKIERSLQGIEHLSKEKREEKERKMKENSPPDPKRERLIKRENQRKRKALERE